MKPSEIEKHPQPKIVDYGSGANFWLREIAYQLSLLGEAQGGTMPQMFCKRFDDLEAQLNHLAGRIEVLIKQGEKLMATQAEFDAKIDTINANTTASAKAAEAIVKIIEDLKATLKDAGLSAAKEAEVLAKLDLASSGTGALKTFLEATAAGGVVGPEPAPVPTPVP